MADDHKIVFDPTDAFLPLTAQRWSNSSNGLGDLSQNKDFGDLLLGTVPIVSFRIESADLSDNAYIYIYAFSMQCTLTLL